METNIVREFDKKISDETIVNIPRKKTYDNIINEFEEENENLADNMPWNTIDQLTEISVEDAAKYSKNKLELFGNTEQANYIGKNLFSGWEEGQINAEGQEYIYKGRFRSSFIEIQPNIDYYFSILEPESSQAFWFTIYKYNKKRSI